MNKKYFILFIFVILFISIVSQAVYSEWVQKCAYKKESYTTYETVCKQVATGTYCVRGHYEKVHVLANCGTYKKWEWCTKYYYI